jgi:hypothetical protein
VRWHRAVSGRITLASNRPQRSRASDRRRNVMKPGRAVRAESPAQDLPQVEYEYGVFAGHWSPFQDTGGRLLSIA